MFYWEPVVVIIGIPFWCNQNVWHLVFFETFYVGLYTNHVQKSHLYQIMSILQEGQFWAIDSDSL